MSTNQLVGGRTQVAQQAEPRWVAEYTTAQLSLGLQHRSWRAFWARMRGGLTPFLGYDPTQEFPAQYPNGFGGMTRAGGGSFDGTATLTGISATQIALSGLPASFIFKEGDHIELRQTNDLRGLYIIISNVTAAAGGTVTLTVEPQILITLFTVAAVANINRPSCVMVPIPESWSYAPTADSFPGASFQAIQRIY